MAKKNAIGGGHPIATADDLRPIERRVLAYLDQRGPTYRQRMVADLASPDSRLGQGIFNGSNSWVPAIAARWCARLLKGGFVGESRPAPDFHHDNFHVTEAGRRMLRSVR